MIDDMVSRKKLNPIVTEVFIRTSNILLFLITQSYFKVRKDVRINSLRYFIIKIPNERELQHIGINHLSDIDFKHFMKAYQNALQKSILF